MCSRIFKYFGLFILLYKCNSTGYECGVYTEKTELFTQYLQMQFHKDIKKLKGKNYFFIIPESACLGCKKTLYDIFKTFKTHPDKSSFYLIISKNNIEKAIDTTDNNILIDRQNNIDRNALEIQNATIIVTENGCISQMIYTTPNNIDSVLNFFYNSIH